MAKARKALRELPPEDRAMLDVYDMRDDIVVMGGYWSYVAEQGYYDGSEFYEDYDVEECPI